MIRVALPAFALAALVSACSPSAPPTAAPAAPPIRSIPAPLVRKADPMAVWGRGVGAVGAHTPFTVEAVKTAWPDATVEKRFLHAGGAPVPILTVAFQGAQALEIQGGPDGKVKTIRVDGGPFRGPGGETLLQPWLEAKFALSDCRMGDGRAVHALVCKRPGVDTIAYVFGIRGWTSNDVPSADALAAKAFLSEFVWTAAE